MASQRLNDSVQKLILLVVLFCNNFLLLLIQVLTFYFPDCGKLAPPVVQVQAMSFKYGKDKVSSFSCFEQTLCMSHFYRIVFLSSPSLQLFLHPAVQIYEIHVICLSFQYK